MIQTYKLKIGDVILVYNDTLLSDLVIAGEELELLRKGKKWPSRPIYSHSAVYIGEGTIIEALSDGLTASKLSKYIGKADVWSHPISGYDRTQIRKHAIDMYMIGYKYSWWLDFLLALRMLFGWHIRWVQRSAVQCSAFLWDDWWSTGLKIAASRACAPEDLAMFGYLRFMGEVSRETLTDDE